MKRNPKNRDMFSDMEDFGYWGRRYAALFRGIVWVASKIINMTVTASKSILAAIRQKTTS